MSLISPRDLTSMRSQAVASFAGSAILQRKTEAADGQGGQDTTWNAYGTVACQLNPVNRIGTDEMVTADQLRSTESRYLVLPALTDFTATDRAVVDGATYEGASVDEPRTMEIVRKAIVTRTR